MAHPMPEAEDNALRVRPGWPVLLPSEGDAAGRLAAAFELYDLALRMVTARVTREHPEWSPATVAEAVAAWTLGAPPPCDGASLRPRPW